MKYILECCCDSVESAIAAEKGGANRLELCSNLMIGGTTPSIALYHAVREAVGLKIHVLLRPRFGDFCYTDHEKQILKEEVRSFREAGADGIVIGALCPDGSLDEGFLSELLQERGSMNVTMHRAFDMCRDPFVALQQCEKLGVDQILTSGGCNDCLQGLDVIEELFRKANGRTGIMAGAGVSADVIRKILEKVPLRSFHMSGKKVIESPMTYRNLRVSMGFMSLSEYEIWRTDEEKIAAAKAVLDQAFGG